ncbi:MAG: site-specific integrase, partial [Planctomycetota bacterium]
MAILAECPDCHTKQSLKNKKCVCDRGLDKAKNSNLVRYWISYRMPNGKQRRESVDAFEGLDGYSINDAREALAKRAVQKKERRIFDMLPASEITFTELAKWYLALRTVKKLASFGDIKGVLDNFNKEFGSWFVDTVKPVDIENYQLKRQEQGRAPATIDKDISIVKTMIIKAFDNDKVDGRALKVFRSVKRKLRKGANA